MRHINLALVGAVLVAMAVVGASLNRHFRNDASGDVPVYASLQAIEFAHRSSPLTGPLFLVGESEGQDAIGLPTDDPGYPNAWIASTKTRGSGAVYLQPPTAHPRLGCRAIDGLLEGPIAARGVAPAVRQYLDQHCTR